MNTNWKVKLSSRKFWVAVINFITNLLVAFNVPDNEIAQISAIIMAGAGLIAYVLAEGFIDAEATKPVEFYAPLEEVEPSKNPIGFQAGGEK